MYILSGYGIFSAYQPYQDHDDGYYQKDVNKSAKGVRGDHPKEPQDKEDDCDCIEHM